MAYLLCRVIWPHRLAYNYVRIMPKCKKNAEIEGTQAIC